MDVNAGSNSGGLGPTALAGQVAIVTGGGGGIGQGIATSLARAGANVVVVDMIAERATQAAEALKSLGVDALPIHADVSDVARVNDMVAEADAHFGRIDILVNNAGGVKWRPFLQQKEYNWRRLIDVNLISMLAATSAAAPIMIRGGRGGSIINVSSIEGSRAAPNYAVYAACKAGMLNFTKSMALELGEYGIRVNAIAPDHTRTPGISGNQTGPVDPSTWIKRTPEDEEGFRAIIPLGYESDIAECGEVVAFLASPMASYVTGVNIPVDGGTMASSGWFRAAGSGTWIQHEHLSGRMPDPA